MVDGWWQNNGNGNRDSGGGGNATAMRTVVAITGGNATLGGDDDGDPGRGWRLRVVPWRFAAGRGRYVVGIADGGLSRPCRARTRERYVVAMVPGKLTRAGGYSRSWRRPRAAQRRHTALPVVRCDSAGRDHRPLAFSGKRERRDSSPDFQPPTEADGIEVWRIPPWVAGS